MTDKQSTVVVSRELAERITRPQLKPRDETVQRRAISELRALLDATSEQAVDVGEPVAYADPQAFINFTAGVATHEWMWAFSDNGLVPLYRYAQPPAKIVLPKQKGPSEYYDPVGTPYSMGWNACLDEVAKLNTPQD